MILSWHGGPEGFGLGALAVERPRVLWSIAAHMSEYADQAGDLAAFVDRLELPRFTLSGVLKQDASGQWVWKMDPAYIERRVKRGAPVRPVLWPALEKPQCPTLVIWGTESDILSEGQARRMAQTLPNGKLVPVPGVGHAPTLTEPAALSAIEQVLGG